MTKLILNLLSWVMAVGAAGTLVDSVALVKREASKSHQRGLISLGKWNKKLHAQ